MNLPSATSLVRWLPLAVAAATAFPQTVFNPPAGPPPSPNTSYVIKGNNFQLGRVAVIDQQGNIVAAAGAASDCVKVDGTNTACSGAPATPAGSDAQVQFNRNGAFSGSSKFAWYDSVGLLDVSQYSSNVGIRARNTAGLHATFYGTGTNLPYTEFSDNLLFLSSPYSMVGAGSGNTVLQINQSVNNGVNYLGITNAASGSPPVLAPLGPDLNIDLSITGKGTGKLRFGSAGHKWPNADGTNGQALVTDGTGNLSFSTITGTGTVTATSGPLTLNLPVIGNGGTDIKVGSVQGNTTKFVSFAGAVPASGNYAKFDASGNLIDGGGVVTTNATQLQSRTVASTAPTNGQALVWNGTLSQWEPQNQAGSGVNATQLQGRNVAATAPTNNQALCWVAANNDWEPCNTATGSVTSVALSAPAEFSVSGSPITSAGTLTLAKANQSANQVYAGPSTGAAAAPAFRALVAADIPTGIPAANISGTAVVQSRQLLNDGTISGTGDLSADRTLGVVPNTTNQRVQVLNGGTLIGTRKALNLIPGTNVTMNVVDNGASDRVDVTLNASAGAGGYSTIQNLGNPLPQRSVVNFTGSINCVDNAGAGRTDCSASSGGTSTVSGLQDCKVTWTSLSVLTVLAPCNVRVGGTSIQYLQSATLTISGNTSGSAWIEIDKTSPTLNLKVNNGGLTIACLGMGCVNGNGNAFDSNAIPIAKWTATSGTWDSAGGSDWRALISGEVPVQAGLGVVATVTSQATTIGVDTAIVPSKLAGMGSVTFTAIANGACQSQTFQLTGATTGDYVVPSIPPGLQAGLIPTVWVTAANTMTVQLCNHSGASLTPGALTFGGMILR